MSGRRVAVVTGSNQGIGLAIVKELCKKFDGAVYLTSRDERRGKAAVEELKKLDLHPKYHQLDINDDSSVLRFKFYLKTTYGGLDVLVNNAAILIVAKDDDSNEVRAKDATAVLKTNYFNTRRACTVLFPILKPHARVVNISSVAGHLPHVIKGDSDAEVALRAKFSSPDLTYEKLDKQMHEFLDSVQRGELEKNGWPKNNYVSYIASKVGLSALSRLQQKDFDQDARDDIIVNFVHPGYVMTNMTSQQGLLTVDQGAIAPAWLALLPPYDAKNPKGAFVWHDKQIVDWVNGPPPAEY